MNNLDTLNTAGLFDTNPHTVPATYANSPFGLFTDAITGNCGPGGSAGCGSTLVFDVANWAGLIAATNLFNGAMIFAAVDILNTACKAATPTASCTGVVGLTSDITINPLTPPVPLPATVWLFGAGVGGVALLMRRRKRTLGQQTIA